MKIIKNIVYLFCYLYFVYSEQNGTQTAYQSSTLSEYGYVYKAELALDQDDLTYSATVASLSDPAWFTLDLGRPYQSGRLHMNLRVIEKKKKIETKHHYHKIIGLSKDKSEEIEETVEIQEAYVVLMNDFDAHSNPPNASIHHVCWKTGELKSFNSFIKSKSCFTETNVTFQYVAVLVPARFQLKVHSIQFKEEARNVALLKKTISNIKSDIWNKAKIELSVDDEKDTCSKNRLKWLLVDLGRPYMIEKVKFKLKNVVSSDLSVLTMNDYYENLNSPNPSVHNVCWEGKLKHYVANSEKNVSCVTSAPYRYVVLFDSSSYMSVCDLQVFEVPKNTTNIEDTAVFTTVALNTTETNSTIVYPDKSEKDFVNFKFSLNGNISIRSSELKKGKHIFLKNRVPLQDWIQVEEKKN